MKTGAAAFANGGRGCEKGCRWLVVQTRLQGASSGLQVQRWFEFATSKGFEDAAAVGELGRVQASLTEEFAQQIPGVAIRFLGITIRAAGDEIAVGVAAVFDARDDVVEGERARAQKTQAIKTTVPFPAKNGSAVIPAVQKVHGFQESVRTNWRLAAAGGDFGGHKHIDDVSCTAALDDAQNALDGEAADRFARGKRRGEDAASEPVHGKMDAAASLQAAVAKQVRVNNVFEWAETQARDDEVFHLLPDLGRIQFLFLHGLLREYRCAMWSAARERRSYLAQLTLRTARRD
jgi:hypothetical protein